MLDASSKTLLTHRTQKPITSFFKFFMINYKQSRFFEYFHFLCSEIQYLAILIWLQSTLITNDDHSLPSLFTRSLCKVIAFKDTLEQNFPVSFISVLTVAIWLYLGIFSLVIICLVFMASKARDIAKPLQKMLSYIFQLHFGVIFWYINVVLIVTITLQKKGQKLPLFAGVEDQDGAFHLIQSILFAFNYVFGIITAGFCFDPLRSNNLFASQTPYFQFLTFSFKAVMLHLVAASSENIIYQILFIIFSVLISTTRLVHLFRNIPFHSHKSTIPAAISATIAAWISVNSIIAFIWNQNDLISTISPVYLMIFILPVIVKLSLNRFRNSIKFYLDMDAKKLKTTREIYGKLFAYQYLSEKVKLSMNENVTIDSSELYFLKDLNHHSVTCQDKECLCSASHTSKSDGKLLDLVNKTKSLLLPYFHARCYNVLIEGIEKIKKNAELKMTMAQLIVANSAHRLNSALIYLFGAADQELGILKRVEKQILVKKIQHLMLSELRHNSEQKINIAHFVDFQTDAAHFLSQIISTTTQYLNFWEAYRKSNLKMSDVMRKSNDIENSANLIEKLWSYNISKYQCFYHLMKEPYGVYLSLVRNTPYASKENIRKLKWKKKGQVINPASSIISASDLASSKVLSFQVSMMRERIGKIISVSENINGSLGFTAQEIIGKNINCLMPASYADKHDQVLLNYLDKAKVSESNDFGAVVGYIKTKAGPILPCSIYITMFPYIQRELAYIGIVKVLKVTSESIIVSKNGYIDSFTKNIGRKLNLLIDKKTHLRDICVDYDKIECCFDIKSNRFTPNSKYRDSPAFDFSLNLDGTLPTIPSQTPGKRPKKDFQSIKITLIFTKENIQAGYSKYSVQLIKKTMENKEFYVLEMEYTGEAEIAPSSSKRVFFNDEIIKNSDDDFDHDVPTERPFITKTQDGSETLRTREGKSGYQRMRTNSTKAAMDLDTSNGRKRTSYFGNPYNVAARLDQDTGALESADDMTEREPVKVHKQISGLGPDMHNNNFLHMESERGSIASTTNNMHKKLEKAIYTLPQDKSLTALKIFSMIFIVICILLLVLFRLQTENKLELVKGNVSVMSISNLRLFEISEINRRTRVISLLRAGLINDNRYLIFGIRSIFPTVSVVLNLVQKNLNTYNSEVRIALEKIEPHLQKQLLENVIPIYDPAEQLSLQYATIFDAATMLIIKTKQLIDTTPALITQTNPAMNFLLNNTLNEQLLVSEQVTDVVLNDNDIKLNFLKSLTLYFIAVWFVIGGLIMALFCYNQLRSFQSRTKFIELFLRLTNEEIEHAMNPVKSFRNLLNKNGFDFKSSQIEESLGISSYSVNLARESVKGSRYLKKDADLKGINYRVIVAFILAFSFLLLLLIPFIYISIIMNKKKEVINTQVDMIVKVNSILSDMNVLSSAIYEYIQYNGTTTVRTKPIGPELEAAFDRLDGAQAFFSDLLEMKSGSRIVTDLEFEQLLTGNLCQYLNISQALCSLVKGVLDKGMIGMNSFIYMTLRNVKDVFDYSDKSFTSAKQALSANNLIHIELIYFLMQLPAYQKLGAILQTRIDGHIQDVDEVLKLLVIISIVIYIVFGLMISICLWKVIEEEKVKWKKMFRKIPFKVVISNKAFTSYLVREFDQAVKK